MEMFMIYQVQKDKVIPVGIIEKNKLQNFASEFREKYIEENKKSISDFQLLDYKIDWEITAPRLKGFFEFKVIKNSYISCEYPLYICEYKLNEWEYPIIEQK